MNRSEIESVVVSVIRRVLKCKIDNKCSREDCNQWDSLKHIEIIFSIEDELNIQFPEEMLSELNDVPLIVDAASEILNES